jgi:hypothetical protein
MLRVATSGPSDVRFACPRRIPSVAGFGAKIAICLV